MPRYHLRTLGGLALVRTDQGSDEEALSNSKALLIPALLATRPGYSARRIDVAELLWPEGDRPRALRALRQALFYLSRYTDTVLERTEDTLTLDPATVSVDLWEFDRAVAAGDHAAAIALARGPFAAGQERKVGAEAEQWIEGVNARMAVGLEVAYAREIERALAEGAGADAVRLARAFAALNPLDEHRQRLLAQTLAATGDQVGALQALEGYRQLSLQALDEEPSPDLEERLQAMRDELRLRSAPAPVLPAPPVPAPPPITRERVSRPVLAIRGRPIGRTALITAGAAVLVLVLLAVALARPRGRPEPGDPFDGIQGRLLAVARNGSTLRVVALGVRGTTASVTDRGDLQPTDLPAPDGRTIATTFQTPQGWDLALRVDGEPPRVVTSAAGDEYPVVWSPDGRYLLYAQRRLLADGRTQSFRLGMYDVVTGVARRLLRTLESREFPTAAWSPDGTRIAFTADAQGVPEVFLIDFNGANLRRLSRHPAWDGDPAWSPDGERIAFVSRRAGTAEVYGVRPDRTDLQRLTRGTGDKHRPVWLSPMTLAVLVGDESESALELIDTFTGRDERVDAPPGLVALVAHPDPPVPWLDRLVITPRVQLASPGQYLALGTTATGPGGAPFTLPFPIEWSVSDPEVARLESPGRIWILGPGRAAIVASAAGWRTDTIVVYSVPLAERDVPVTFEEDWTRGLDRERWRPFGDPAPRTPRAGPDSAAVFANRGDEFFASGAVTRDAFPLRGGLGVEVEGRMPFTGKLHQEFGVALYAEDHPDSALASGAAPALVEFRVQGPSGAGPAEAWIATPKLRVPLPVPGTPGDWHTYAIQVLADGGLELVVDGRMFWRSPEPLLDRDGAVRIGLGFQSFETEIQHGRIRLFTPPRYYVPEIVLDDHASQTP